MNRTLILLHGANRSGKDTAFEAIDDATYGTVLNVKFADVLKSMLTAALLECYGDWEFVHECVEGKRKEQPLEAFAGLTTRTMLRLVGTDYRELINHDLWVDATLLDIEWRIKRGFDNVICITDLRFPEEYALIDRFAEKHPSWRCKTLKITRPNYWPYKDPMPNDEPELKRRAFVHGRLDKRIAEIMVAAMHTALTGYWDGQDEAQEEEYAETVREALNHTPTEELVDMLVDIFGEAHDKQRAWKAGTEIPAADRGLHDRQFGHVVANDGTIAQFKYKVVEAVKE